MGIDRIRRAIAAVKVAKRALARTVEESFPVGAEIHWDRGGRRQHGVVLDHNGSGEVRVENERTKKVYWITMYDVTGYVA